MIQTTISTNTSSMSNIDRKTTQSLRQNSGRKAATRNRHIRSCMFKIPWHSEFSATGLVKDLAGKVTNAFRSVPMRRSLHRDSPSLVRSRSAVSSVDSHRTAAVEDCIEFIHSSFSRSNSSTATSREDSIDAP